jgi:predicted secreted hydrolase
VTFNIFFNATTSALINGGVGKFKLGEAIVTSEWGLPACRTSGTLKINGRTKDIDSENSLTWYDRQFGEAASSTSSKRSITERGRITTRTTSALNWTWLELHIPATTYKLSIWNIDAEGEEFARFGTIRKGDGSLDVVPVTWTPDYSLTYTSPNTGNIYPLRWSIEIAGWGSLSVLSASANQEISGPADSETAYEGFVTLTGHFADSDVSGYGVVEITSA